MRYYYLFFLILIAVCTTRLDAQKPWEEHGKLEVSENGHYIQHKDNTPFLWIGGTGWGMIQQITREEIDLYLDNRAALGFTVIQTVAHWSPHGGGLERSPDNAANAYGHRPFTGTENAPNTSEPLVVKGGSPNAPNDYWDHVDYVIEAAKKRNLYLAILPCWASQLITGTAEYNEKEARIYGQFLGKRYGNEPNIIWVLGGDTKARFMGYDKYQRYYDFDNRHIFRAMAEGIVLGTTGQKLAWNEAGEAWNEVFITYHPNGDYPYGSSQWFHKDEWLDANGVEVWKEVHDVFPVMLDDYKLKDPVKPSLFLEGSYEYGTYHHECGWVTPLKVRRQFYHTFFAGGAGHTYGAGPIWAMRGNEGDYNCGYTWQQALDFPGAIQVAQIAKKFLTDYKWYEWVPNNKVISGTGYRESLKTSVTTKSGDMALVYFSNNSHTTVKNILNNDADAFWFYPRNGELIKALSIQKNETRVMVPPAKWEDAILVLRLIEK